MANISQEVNIEMLEKLPDGTYKRKYPKTRSDTGVTFDEHLADSENPHSVTKLHVGLGNVDNIKQIPMNVKGQPNGVAELGSDGKVPLTQLSEQHIESKKTNGTSSSETVIWSKPFGTTPVVVTSARGPVGNAALVDVTSVSATSCTVRSSYHDNDELKAVKYVIAMEAN